MSAIKDMIDLITQLSSKVEDKKFAGEVREILKMAGNLQAECAEIRESNFRLMQENAKFQQLIASLKQQKEQTEGQGKNSGKGISKEEDEILLLLSEVREATSDEIAHKLEYNPTKTEYWLENLCDKDMISFSVIIDQPTIYYLAQEGRGYLIENEFS